MDAEILRCAASQHGALGREQLVEQLGMSRATLHRARARGVLIDVTTRTYRLASSPESFLQRCHALQLHAAGHCFLGSITAARLYGLRRMGTERVHVFLPRSPRLVLPKWAVGHYSRWYQEDRDSCWLGEGLRVASPLRMLFSLAAELTQFRFERAAEDAWHLGLVDPAQAVTYLDAHRCRGKNGVRRMETWLERIADQARPAQSYLERDLLDAIERAGLPQPVRQHPVVLRTGETVHVDIAWPSVKLAVEPGASWWHGGDAAQRRDQTRDRALAELGWHTIRFDEALREDLIGAARQIRTIHRRRAADLHVHG